MTYNKKKILQFKKTKHFIQRAFERGICDEFLEFVLRYYEDQRYKIFLAVFESIYFQKHNIRFAKKYLAVVVENNELLITAYWCNDIDECHKKSKSQKIILFPSNFLKKIK